MIDWTKPNGAKIQTNEREETITKALSMGWKADVQNKPEPEPEPEPIEPKPKPRLSRRSKA